MAGCQELAIYNNPQEEAWLHDCCESLILTLNTLQCLCKLTTEDGVSAENMSGFVYWFSDQMNSLVERPQGPNVEVLKELSEMVLNYF